MFEEISRRSQDNLCLYCRESARVKDSLFCSTKCAADLEYHLQRQKVVDKFLDGYQKLEF
jgi:predicted nucleic acid-binding Zn ribbon protein